MGAGIRRRPCGVLVILDSDIVSRFGAILDWKNQRLCQLPIDRLMLVPR